MKTALNDYPVSYSCCSCLVRADTVFIHLGVCYGTMANIKTEDEIILFEREMKEFWTKLKSVYGTEQISQTLALRDSCKESIKVLSGKKALVTSCSKLLSNFFFISINNFNGNNFLLQRNGPRS